MLEKYGRFYADWRDKKGVRRRKSFATRGEAMAYEEQQKAGARGKVSRAASPSRKPLAATSKHGSVRSTVPLVATTSGRPVRSSRTAAVSKLETSHKPICSKPARPGIVSRTQRATPVLPPLATSSASSSQKRARRLDSTAASRKSANQRPATLRPQRTNAPASSRLRRSTCAASSTSAATLPSEAAQRKSSRRSTTIRKQPTILHHEVRALRDAAGVRAGQGVICVALRAAASAIRGGSKCEVSVGCPSDQELGCWVCEDSGLRRSDGHP